MSNGELKILSFCQINATTCNVFHDGHGMGHRVCTAEYGQLLPYSLFMFQFCSKKTLSSFVLICLPLSVFLARLMFICLRKTGLQTPATRDELRQIVNYSLFIFTKCNTLKIIILQRCCIQVHQTTFCSNV